jgi:hypothetical protein
MNEARPDMQHPLVQLVAEVALHGSSVGSNETYVLDDVGLEALAKSLLEHAEDPTLPGGVIGLFALASALYEEHNSKSAGEAIILLLGKLGPRLRALGANPDAGFDQVAPLARQIELKKKAFASFAQTIDPNLAPSSSSPPEGSISVGALTSKIQRRIR